MEKILNDPSKLRMVIILFAVILCGVIYILFRPKVDPRLAEAKTRVKVETKKLDDLNARYVAEQSALAELDAQYALIRDKILSNTDVFFDNVDSSNPELILKLKNKNLEKDMIKRRLEIAKLLKEWDKKIADIKSGNIPQGSSFNIFDIINGAKKDTDYVKQYISDFKKIIDGLTPQNSDVTQSQLNYYHNIIESSLNQIEEVSTNINNVNNNITQVYNSNPNGTTTTPTNNQNTPPVVTPQQIQNQQEVVNQATQQQNNLQNATTTSQTPTPPPYDPYVINYLNEYQGIGAQTLIEYLQSIPAPKIDKTGWPDIDDNSSGNPIMVGGGQ